MNNACVGETVAPFWHGEDGKSGRGRYFPDRVSISN